MTDTSGRDTGSSDHVYAVDTNRSIETLLHPESVAIIGLSRQANHRSQRILSRLRNANFRGKVSAVSPHYTEFSDIDCYQSLADIPHKVDVALIVLASNRAIRALRECVQQQVRAAIVYAAVPGNTELFNRQIRETIAGTRTRVLGPNCVGAANIADGIYMTYGYPFEAIDQGPVEGASLVGQSGGALLGIASHALRLSTPIAHFVSCGNEADLSVDDFIRYFAGDQNTKVVAAYIEAIRRPQSFVEAASRIRCNDKHLVLLRVGKSRAAQSLARSHTGALVGDFGHAIPFLKAAGVYLAKSMHEAAVASTALCKEPVNRTFGVGIVATTGGIATTMADLCAARNLPIPRMAEASCDLIKGLLSEGPQSTQEIGNPVDLGSVGADNPEALLSATEILLRDPAFGVVIAATNWRNPEWIVQAKLVAREVGKGLIVYLYTARREAPYLDELQTGATQSASIFGTDEEAAQAAEILQTFSARYQLRARDPSSSIRVSRDIEGNAAIPNTWLASQPTEYEMRQWLAKCGIGVPRGGEASDPREAEGVAARIGYPVVLKIAEPRLAHKTDVGGVIVNIRNATALREATQRLNESLMGHDIRGPYRYFVEEMVEGTNIEWFIGVRDDSAFGPTVIVGLGGLLVESIADVVTRPAPVTSDESMGMLKELRAWPTLRLRNLVTNEELVGICSTVADISNIAVAFRGAVREISLNPVVWRHGRGSVVLDATVEPAMQRPEG